MKCFKQTLGCVKTGLPTPYIMRYKNEEGGGIRKGLKKLRLGYKTRLQNEKEKVARPALQKG